MAKESFDKEIQFLRMLVLTSGAYSRQQFADRLGISVHTFDKTIKRLKEVVSSVQRGLPEEQSKEFAETIRYHYLDSSDPMLLFLFRAKSLKESESQRLSLLLAALHEKPLTAMELLDACCSALPASLALPDEKTIRADLKYLEQVGVIKKTEGPRPYRYRIHNDLARELSADELNDLYDFVDIMANTQLPSLQGYLLRDGLKKHRSRLRGGEPSIEPFIYKYHYYSRILDEAHLFALLGAIRARQTVGFLYFSPKKETSYASKNTNPLFERDTEGKQETVLPLKIVYDHQYGRWYLLGHHHRHGIKKYRLEGLTQIDEGESVSEERFAENRALLELRLKHSWLIDTGRAVKVRIRFFNPGPGIPNFVKERVLLQGQWGTVEDEEGGDSFLYEIDVNGTTEIKPWIRSFGSSCEVLAPPGLRQEMIEEWKEIKAYYESV
ncbi:helix-turn-helix transcriptional regulator [Paenibacillus arenilitoris]|uniref:WYL domain-containing protein n=1 Tax=Paenibacillus arenilitoris TaxID=2772299 RepID=A0A927CT61_9BACL|nr:WYL domain-containing protein [Paenibacillus arenilitoris]MBD2872752.1 WYL domain-containing protein [Paenibacillus arenilitoris]